MPVHAFVDESKQRGYFVVAALLGADGVSVARKAMGKLSLPGQPRVHFVRERDSRRRQILDGIATLGAEARCTTRRAIRARRSSAPCV